MIHTILVPTDFSDGAGVALERAEELARSTAGELVLLHVHEEYPIMPLDGTVMVPPGLDLELRAALEKALEEKVVAVRKHGVAVRGLTVSGTAHVQIDAVAAREKADLIVMGTHGRRGLGRLVLGSVAERVARTTKVPVLVVRPARPS